MALALISGASLRSTLSLFMGGNNNFTIDAANELIGIIGHMRLNTGRGTSAVISAAGGGAMFWACGSATWNNASSFAQLGLQDVSGNFHDGSFDVSATLQGGTDTIAANALLKTAMESGSKTVTHGDLVAALVTLTGRGGADALGVRCNNIQPAVMAFPARPYRISNTGTGNQRLATSSVPAFSFLFDNGAVGWIDPFPLQHHFWSNPASVAYNSSSSPNEYASAFDLAQEYEVDWMGLHAAFPSGGTAELILYSDPLGSPSPVVTRTINVDAVGENSTTPIFYGESITATTLPPGTYAVALRATHASNQVRYGYYDLGTGLDDMKKIAPFDNVRVVSRTTSGAFTVVNTRYLPSLHLNVSAAHDGLSVGGGGSVESGSPVIGAGVVF